MSLKDSAFGVYSLFFNLGAAIGVKKGRVGLVSMHNASFKDGLYEVQRSIGDRLTNCEFIRVDRTDLHGFLSAIKFITLDALKLGRCEYIFLNDNFMPLSGVKPRRETTIVQLWHGQGAFKKFGLHIPQPENIRNREIAANSKLSYVVCSSESVREIYSQAFGVEESRVLPVGVPDGDYYFRQDSADLAKENVFRAFPELRGKYIVLYAPTFRDGKGDKEILDNFSPDSVRESLSKHLSCKADDIAVILRLHPQVNSGGVINGCVNATDYDSISELCLVSDLLITDYSSVCMDFALLGKPAVFYAFDLDEYDTLRSFYFDYESYVFGPIARNGAELDEILSTGKFECTEVKAKAAEFRNFNFTNPDGHATKRLLDIICP